LLFFEIILLSSDANNFEELLLEMQDWKIREEERKLNAGKKGIRDVNE
jgi:hypothetical protein